DLAEGFGVFPGDGERADAAGARAADRVHVGVFGDRVLLLDFGDDFFEEEAGVAVAKAVVFEAAVAAGAGAFGVAFAGVVAGVDEDGDRGRHVATGDEVVEDDGDTPAAFHVGVAAAVLEDHEGSGLVLFVLSGNIDGPVASGVGEDLG